MHAASRRAIALAAAATLLAAFSPATAGAAPAEKPVQMKNGILQADGAAVRLPTTFTCPPGFEAFLSAQIVQAIGKKFAVGFDSAARQCTGEQQKITFYVQSVPAGENTRPFKPGDASARVILDAFDPNQSGPFFEEEPLPAEPESQPSILPSLPIDLPAGALDEPEPGPVPEAEADFAPAPDPVVHAEDRSTIRLRER